MINLSVVVPCFNEQKNIEELVSTVLKIFTKNEITGELVLVNDGSLDDTAIEIERFSKQFKNVLGVNHSKNLGIAEAWHSGLEMSNAEYVVTIDADLQYNPEDIIVLYNEIIKNNYDLVQGWRREYRAQSLFRKFLSRSLSCLLNILFLRKINDIKSGFVIYKRKVFFDILNSRNKVRSFQHFFILCALSKGYRFKQVPVKFYPRKKGRSFIKNPLFLSFAVLSDIPKAILNFKIISRKAD